VLVLGKVFETSLMFASLATLGLRLSPVRLVPGLIVNISGKGRSYITSMPVSLMHTGARKRMVGR
jgi:hypothetical protein